MVDAVRGLGPPRPITGGAPPGARPSAVLVPLYEADDRPSDIFSWAEGVYVGAPEEWEALQSRYRAAWPSCWP